MGILLNLSTFALQSLVGPACKALGLEAGAAAVNAVADYLKDWFTPHNARLTEALRQANKRAWQTLEFALAGNSLLDVVARAEDRAFREELRSFLESVQVNYPQEVDETFRGRCLEELRTARQQGLLDQGALDPRELAREVGRFAEFADPGALLKVHSRALQTVAEAFPEKRFPHLVRFLRFQVNDRSSVLVAGVRYFFRQQVIKDEALRNEVVFARLETLPEVMEEGFGSLAVALDNHGQRLEGALGRLDGRMGALTRQVEELARNINGLLDQRQLRQRPLRPGDSQSIRDEGEREFVRQLVSRYRALPTEQRQHWPELLSGVGKLEMAVGTYAQAEQDFQKLAGLVGDPSGRAEAHYNAYQAALEEGDPGKALQHLVEACKIEQRFAPFPLDKYRPERILGAGGFGVAFLCRDQHLDQAVVVKALLLEDFDRDSVLNEARALNRIKHPVVINLRDCDYMDRATRLRPYLVVDYFEGATLSEYVRKNGPLPLDDFKAVVAQIAEALSAAHQQGILHRDVKPANILLRREGTGWGVRLIDFGLALRQGASRVAVGEAPNVGSVSITGTLEYASPEQLGRLANMPVDRRSDIYSFARTCLFALFGTTQPLRKHWAELPGHLIDILESGLAENPNERPRDMREMLQGIMDPRAASVEDQGRTRILNHYLQRLSASISRSPLLKVSLTRASRLLDVARLARVDPKHPADLLASVIESRGRFTLNLRPAPRQGPGIAGEAEEGVEGLHDLLDRKVRRHAELSQRETGVHALWLGYPLFYAATGSGETDRWVLAPLFLWPISIEPDPRMEKQLRIERAQEPELARFNRVLSLWVRRELGFSLAIPSDEELADLNRETLQAHLNTIAAQFPEVEAPKVGVSLGPVPDKSSLPAGKPCLVNAAVLGFFRWQNEAILSDLEEILANTTSRGVVTGFISTARLAQPPEVQAPPEEDRFLVSDTDFSQEKVVWQARTGPGLVVHGPPGTGKSQTIVNVIADTLAHRQTVLMVCQKQAATRVVLERLRAAGLEDLCLEVHDAEQDRKPVFQAIKGQRDRLRPLEPGRAAFERQQLAGQITELEGELDRFARAFHERHPRIGLSYREIKDREQQVYQSFPSARPLPSLQQVVAGLSADTVEEICHRVRQVGRWYAEADPLSNPWRRARFDVLPPLPQLRADVGSLLRRLREQDAEHLRHLQAHGAGMALPEKDFEPFIKAVTEVAEQFRSLASRPCAAALAWLPWIRQSDDAQRQRMMARCHEAAELARQIESRPLDPHWCEVTGKTSDFQNLAETILRWLDAAKGAEDEAIVLPWLRALRGADAHALHEHSLRCQQAQELAQCLGRFPVNPDWAELDRQVPDLVGVATPFLKRLQELIASPTQNALTRAWLRALRGPGGPQAEQFKEKCKQAATLAHRAKTPVEARWEAAARQADFLDTAHHLLSRLDQLRNDRTTLKGRLIPAWMRVLRQASEAELRERTTECQEAAELARRVTLTVPDSAWEGLCANHTLLELEVLRTQAEEFLRRSSRWLRFLDGTYRRSRRALQQLRPGVAEEGLRAVAQGLILYVQARQLREQLRAINRRLLPEYAPSDEAGQSSFPRTAGEALEIAVWFIRQERQRPWCAELIDHEFGPRNRDGRQPLPDQPHQSQPGSTEESLRRYLETLKMRKQLEQFNQSLVPGAGITLKPEAQFTFPTIADKMLDHALWLLNQARSHPWLKPALDAFLDRSGSDKPDQLTSLQGYLERRRLEEQLAVLNQDLVPGHQPQPTQRVDPGYTTAALNGFKIAEQLCRLQGAYPWVAPLLEELLSLPGQSSPLRTGLKTYLADCQLRKRLGDLNQRLMPRLTPVSDESAQPRFALESWEGFQQAEGLAGLARKYPWVEPHLNALLAAQGTASLARFLDQLECCLRRYPLLRALLETLLQLKSFLEDKGLGVPYIAARDGGTVAPWAEQLEKGLETLQALVQFEQDRKRRSGAAGEVLKVLEEYERERARGARVPVPGEGVGSERHGGWWAALVMCSATTGWQRVCQGASPELLHFAPEAHAEKIDQLGRLLAKKRALEAEVIRQGWAARQLEFKDEQWNRMFQERNSKGGPAKRLREAIESSWDRGLTALRPCWLVNPSAASQIFPLVSGLFDLVIFDEASQCPMEQAIPAIYRGKRLVVCGDEKQLPPTMFFSAAADVEDEETDGEEAEASEDPAESLRRRQRRAEEGYLMQVSDLLEGAIGKLKQLYLCVHYRSDHPALIEFSNRAFYGGQLEAPPAWKTSFEGERPIEYHAANGLYLDRTNQDEAAQVLTVLRRLWSENALAPTAGVVTFNQAQRDLIEDLIEQECQNDEELNRCYRRERDRQENNQDAGFFVKNLENVQGDERDVMIFSTTFGRDGQGRFFRRFGPVGVVGGHRRLNVAVTRAKRRVIVVGSMPINQIAQALMEGTSAPLTPAGYLQLYLAYAEAVSNGDEKFSRRLLDRLGGVARRQREESPKTTLEADIISVVEGMGYPVERGVGDTGFRIALGVRHPNPKRGYLLGIECDGGVWFGDRPARIREVWRPLILRQKDWRLYSIWSASWWANRDSEVQRLRVALGTAAQ